MIKQSISIRGKATPSIKIKGKTNASIIRMYPELEDISIKPTFEKQVLKSEKYGFGNVVIEAMEDVVDTRDATATSSDLVEGTTAYVNNLKIEGHAVDNGTLEYTPSLEMQVIPKGFTSGGIVNPTVLTNFDEYNNLVEEKANLQEDLVETEERLELSKSDTKTLITGVDEADQLIREIIGEEITNEY